MKLSHMLAVGFLVVAGCKAAPQKNLGTSVSGEIKLAPTLVGKVEKNNTVFIIAKGGFGPPVAVKKLTNVTFPFQFTLTEADSMTPGQPWQGPVKITARVDKDGNANPLSDGDLWGETKNPVSQEEKVAILIDKEFTNR